MATTDDDVITTTKWEVERRGAQLVFTSRTTKGEVYRKQYATKHAAICAFGRVRYEHKIADQIVANVQIEKIKGPRKKRSPNEKKLIRSDYLLFSAIELLAKAADIPEKQAETRIFRRCGSRVKNGQPFTGVSALRTRIQEENKRLRKELDAPADPDAP